MSTPSGPAVGAVAVDLVRARPRVTDLQHDTERTSGIRTRNGSVDASSGFARHHEVVGHGGDSPAPAVDPTGESCDCRVGHKEVDMIPDRTVSVAEAKSTLSELVSAAESGETIVITKRGKPVAEMRARHRPRAKVDLAVLRHATAGMTPQDESAEDVVRRMRDDARY